MLLPHLNTIWLEKQIHLFDSYKPVIAFSQSGVWNIALIYTYP